jgi:HlyD family secretion protein
MSTGRVLKWLLVAALLVAAVWGVRRLVTRVAPVVVRTARLERGVVEATVTNSKAGTVEARRRAKLSPGTSGVVVEVAVERGQHVKRGEVLVRLADESQRAQVQLGERSLDVAQAEHRRTCLAAERAAREYERNRLLAERGVVSSDALDQFESAYHLSVAACEVAAANVEEARARIEVARAELDKTLVRAPFDGVVAEAPVQLGEWATPSSPLIVAPDVVDVIDPTSIYIAAPMDEVDSGSLAPGLPARVTLDAFAGRSFAGRIVRIAPYVLDLESQNRTVEIEVELDDAEFGSRLLPGSSADVEVILQVRNDVLRAPSRALLEGGRVLIVENGRLVERRLELGLRNWDWSEVLGGLEAGREVVISLEREGVEAGVEALVEGRP